jgi:hypothetical protein
MLPLFNPYLVPPDPPAAGSKPHAAPNVPDWRPGWAAPYIAPIPYEPLGVAPTMSPRHGSPAPPLSPAAAPLPLESTGQALVTVGATGLALATIGILILGARRRRW